MNAAESYKQRIEAIVHPVSARNQQKNTMRRELWAHFLALAGEEGGDREACERAWARMGDPAALRKELEATVTESDKLIAAIDRFVIHSLDEPFARFAWRLGRAFLVMGGSALAAAVTLVAWTEPLERAMSIIAIMAPLIAWLYCLVLVLQPAMRYAEDMAAQSRARHPGRTAVVKTVANLACALAITPLFYLLGFLLIGFILGFSQTETLVYLYIGPIMYAFVWSQTAFAVLLMAFRTVQTAKVIENWPYA